MSIEKCFISCFRRSLAAHANKKELIAVFSEMGKSILFSISFNSLSLSFGSKVEVCFPGRKPSPT